jgi:hypothetical protein
MRRLFLVRADAAMVQVRHQHSEAALLADGDCLLLQLCMCGKNLAQSAVSSMANLMRQKTTNTMMATMTLRYIYSMLPNAC